MTLPPVLPPSCSNWTPGISVCSKQGTKSCANCKLVVYCDVDCQKAH
ncbi:hypothetical protein M7I_4940 [Glarea lozoyensis 74030]|uniref:MYND-type domain-containing protein n=1 Tax=Glarea lozoyensis (strain ATCC 74030 / MF5533) TaxID=1104152 RepID=H0EQI8_GLAL7|nr:hypothetical protein M7I_4940 [Glarea lozoyensis 74030]